MSQIVAEKKKLHGDLVIVKSLNHKLEEKIVYLKKPDERGAV